MSVSTNLVYKIPNGQQIIHNCTHRLGVGVGIGVCVVCFYKLMYTEVTNTLLDT